MKKLIGMISCILACMLFLNVFSVAAANTTEKSYRYTNGTSKLWHETTRYNKTNTSKVYVKPKKSPSGETYVQTYCYVKGKKTNKTFLGTVKLKNRTKAQRGYLITNYVYEHGDKTNGRVSMWLRVKPTSGAGVTSGVWSPDWSGGSNADIIV